MSELNALNRSSFGVMRDEFTVNVLLTPKSTWLTRGVNSVPGAESSTAAVDGVRPGITRAPGVQLPLQFAAYVIAWLTFQKEPRPFGVSKPVPAVKTPYWSGAVPIG